MKMTLEEVRQVAALARLGLSPEEEKATVEQLDKILEYMEKLNSLDTGNVEPLAHVVDIVNAFREDVAVSWPFTEALLQNAPAREKNFFKVPKIIE
jgi:aspartyl-tRNA(Asn)/glutamyl-tRNA(Gln) amidotransferase subunit C